MKTFVTLSLLALASQASLAAEYTFNCASVDHSADDLVVIVSPSILTTKSDANTVISQDDCDYARDRTYKPTLNTDYVRYEDAGKGCSSDGLLEYLVSKPMLAGKNGSMKAQLRGESFSVDKFSCTRKKD